MTDQPTGAAAPATDTIVAAPAVGVPDAPAAASAAPTAPTGEKAPAVAAPAAPGDAPKKGGDTILEGQGTGKDTAPPADWPADWRTRMAGDDKKLLAQLERFGSPTDLAEKIRQQDALIAQGKHKATLPKDATPEQLAAYRKENGIPETPEKYDLTLADGLIVGEEDKPIVNNMLNTMHTMNLNNEQVKNILGAYYKQEKQFLIDRDNNIAANRTKQDDELHADWGNEYRPNLTAIGSLVKTFTNDTRNALAGALDSEGFPLLNNKAFLKDMAVMARTINPIDTVVSGGGSNQMSSVEDEIKGIEARMGGLDPTYYKDQKAQSRYLQLIEWREKQKVAR